MAKVWKATRSLHYVTTSGEDRVVATGEIVTDASEGKIADLIADGFVREGRTQNKE